MLPIEDLRTAIDNIEDLRIILKNEEDHIILNIPVKTIIATIRIVVKEDANIIDITENAGYSFEHESIIDTEWIDTQKEE